MYNKSVYYAQANKRGQAGLKTITLQSKIKLVLPKQTLRIDFKKMLPRKALLSLGPLLFALLPTAILHSDFFAVAHKPALVSQCERDPRTSSKATSCFEAAMFFGLAQC